MLYADTTSTAGGENLCPRCGGSVFQAEEIVEKGLSYHKRQCYQLYLLETCTFFYKKSHEIFKKINFHSVVYIKMELKVGIMP